MDAFKGSLGFPVDVTTLTVEVGGVVAADELLATLLPDADGFSSSCDVLSDAFFSMVVASGAEVSPVGVELKIGLFSDAGGAEEGIPPGGALVSDAGELLGTGVPLGKETGGPLGNETGGPLGNVTGGIETEVPLGIVTGESLGIETDGPLEIVGILDIETGGPAIDTDELLGIGNTAGPPGLPDIG